MHVFANTNIKKTLQTTAQNPILLHVSNSLEGGVRVLSYVA
jgi:hypothetical protein